MKSIPPKTDAVDDAWAAGGEGESDFDLAGLFIESAPPPAAPPKGRPAAALDTPGHEDADDFALVDLGELFVEDHASRPTPIPGDAPSGPAKSSKSTLRPPQPEAEYVADMMERALSPWPAAAVPAAPTPLVPRATPSGFTRSELDFDFADIGFDESPAPAARGGSPPDGGRPTPRPEPESERPTHPGDVPEGGESDLDLELDRALGSHAPSTRPSAREASPPQTQRGLGVSSFPEARSGAVGEDDAVEIIEFGPPTPPPPAASSTPPARAAVVAPRPAPSASPPRLAGRPRSAAGMRAPAVDRTPPSLDNPFASASTARLGAVMAGDAHPTPPAPRPRDPISLVRDRFDLGDYSGALVQAEAVLEDRPNDPEAMRFADACRVQLLQMYLSRIGDRTQVPRVVMEPDQLRWLSLDHRAGFLLSVIDGTSSIDDLLDVSGMQELDTLRILYDFVLQGVIQMGPGRRRRR